MSPDERVLDDPVWQSLAGPHAALARRSGSAARYCDEVPMFAALQGSLQAALADLEELVEPGDAVALAVAPSEPLAPGWAQLHQIHLMQMVCEPRLEAPDPPRLLAPACQVACGGAPDVAADPREPARTRVVPTSCCAARLPTRATRPRPPPSARSPCARAGFRRACCAPR